MNYEEIKQKFPNLNWKEAEEIDDSELEAAAAFFDDMMKKRKAKKREQEMIELGKSLLKFTPVNVSDKIAGCSLSTALWAGYSELVDIFGEPNDPGDGRKISTRWILEYQDGRIVTIYDYIQTNLFNPNLESVESFRRKPKYNWHIGCLPGSEEVIPILFNAVSTKNNIRDHGSENKTSKV